MSAVVSVAAPGVRRAFLAGPFERGEQIVEPGLVAIQGTEPLLVGLGRASRHPEPGGSLLHQGAVALEFRFPLFTAVVELGPHRHDLPPPLLYLVAQLLDVGDERRDPAGW